jgi:hypothetical protein
MPKFTSFDGVDSKGIRAEVNVQTGTGRIKEVNPRGKASADGTYRNVEVVFDPDNPALKRKVYALLDTTAKDLWEFVQKAHADQSDVAFRIESQRKRNVDRTKKFEDLIHTEEVVRVLAALDNVFSHEAKTNPKEDPTNDGNPSALTQDIEATKAAVAASNGSSSSSVSPALAVKALADARRAGLSDGIVDALAALALASGASIADVQSAGFDAQDTPAAPALANVRIAASEEKPWIAYNSDGRINAGSYLVAHAASAERFALDHLIKVYSEGKKSQVDVSAEMIAQAASIALVLLEASDDVQVRATGGRTDRQKNSYNRAMSLVLDAVEKRYPVPVGGNDQARADWYEATVAEAAERLYGVLEVAQGRLPKPEAERAVIVQTPVVSAPVAAPVVESAGESVLASVFGATSEVVPGFKAPSFPSDTDPDFVTPEADLIGRVRDLCVAASVAGDAMLVSNWLERVLGVRATRKVHGPVLEQFVTFYEKAGTEQVRAEVLGAGVAAQ